MLGVRVEPLTAAAPVTADTAWAQLPLDDLALTVRLILVLSLPRHSGWQPSRRAVRRSPPCRTPRISERCRVRAEPGVGYTVDHIR
jgi:hypothetical protein